VSRGDGRRMVEFLLKGIHREHLGHFVSLRDVLGRLHFVRQGAMFGVPPLVVRCLLSISLRCSTSNGWSPGLEEHWAAPLRPRRDCARLNRPWVAPCAPLDGTGWSPSASILRDVVAQASSDLRGFAIFFSSATSSFSAQRPYSAHGAL